MYFENKVTIINAKNIQYVWKYMMVILFLNYVSTVVSIFFVVLSFINIFNFFN